MGYVVDQPIRSTGGFPPNRVERRMSQVRNELVALIDGALGPDPKEALIAARRLGQELDWLQQRAVTHARVNGYDWGQIGRLLGLTRQGARKKFPLAPTPSRPHVVLRNRQLRAKREAERMLQRFRDHTTTQPPEDDPVFW